MQVYRALRPAPTSDACRALLAGLHKCLSVPAAPTALRMAVDIVLTLQVCASQSLEAVTPQRSQQMMLSSELPA